MHIKPSLNYASQWRLAIAQQVAPIIARNPKVQAIMLAGSTSRGWADSYSDIEIGVFWAAPPSDEERMAHIAPAGGVFWELDPYDPEHEIWMEEWGLGGLKIDVRNLTVDKIEAVLHDVVDNHDISTFKHETLTAVQNAISLYNAPLLEQWKGKLTPYPDELAYALVREHIQLYEWRWWGEQLISREDWSLFYSSLSEAICQMFSALIGLNRMYHPGFKWMDRWIGEMQITPVNYAARIKEIFHVEPHAALLETQKLVLEVYDLVSLHMPEINIEQVKHLFLRWRQQFELPPEL